VVLIVDDHPEACYPLARFLARAGVEAACVESGPAALSFIHQHPTSLLLLDVMMPGMDGFDVLRAVRSDPRFSALPVVMYTALTEAESREKALVLGAQDFITKPGSLPELLALVKKYGGIGGAGDC
jgi:CheY-like chemotaxis protein